MADRICTETFTGSDTCGTEETVRRLPKGRFFVWRNFIGGVERTFVQIKTPEHGNNMLYLMEDGRTYVKIPSSILPKNQETESILTKYSVLPDFFVFKDNGKNLETHDAGIYKTSKNYINYENADNSRLLQGILNLAEIINIMPYDKVLEGTVCKEGQPIEIKTLQMLDWRNLAREIKKGYLTGGERKLNIGILEEDEAAVLTPNGRFVHLGGSDDKYMFRHGKKYENGAITYVVTGMDSFNNVKNRFWLETHKVVKSMDEE